jgi:hypothetical protein
VPKFGLATPLKVKDIRAYPNRSALLDITPTTITQRKHKGNKTSNTEVVHHQYDIEKPEALYDSENYG